MTTITMRKESVNRLLKDVKNIMKNPLTEQGIYYIHDDTNMLTGYAMIVGPTETPYFGGFYFFKFMFPYDYPYSPPEVQYCTNGNGIRFNPNLYVSGKVCVSLLNTWRGEQWTSCQTISTVLLSLCTLLCKDPLLNEPGVTKAQQDVKKYNEIIEYSNIDIAICDIINKKPSVYLPFFDLFYTFIKDLFIKNYDTIIKFAEKKSKDKNIEDKRIITRMYNLNVAINYTNVITKLIHAKEICEQK